MTGLQKHSCVSTKSYPQLDTFMASACAVASTVKSDIADVDVVMCATDIRPFDIVEGVGFQQFCRKILQIGKKYGDGIDIKQLLPAPRTVARHVPDRPR